MNPNEKTIKTKQMWNDLSKWWDKSIEDGDLFHKTFIFPTILNYLRNESSQKVLDIGCGNGALSRLISENYKAEIIGVDFSQELISCAIKRSSQYKNIKFFTLDATNLLELKQLNDYAPFDRIVCSMALHDMWTIDPLISSLKSLLQKNGSFIFSIPHPCFNSNTSKFEIDSDTGNSYAKISNYINCESFEILAKPNQPTPFLSFHRPLSYIFNLLIKEGFCIDGIEEPVSTQNAIDNSKWTNFKNIPPVIISKWNIK